jgi:hypothetical protein
MRVAISLALVLAAATGTRQGCGGGDDGPPNPPQTTPPQGECVDKPCGAECLYPDLPCLHASPPCLPPVAPGHCDAAGACVLGYPPPPGSCPPDPCAGKKCGDACDRCGGMCMSPIATACDAAGACVPVPVTCGP